MVKDRPSGRERKDGSTTRASRMLSRLAACALVGLSCGNRVVAEDGAEVVAVDVYPRLVVRGQQTRVVGAGFSPGEVVAIQFEGTHLADVATDGQGRFSKEVTIPPGKQPGPVYVEVRGTASARQAKSRLWAVAELPRLGVEPAPGTDPGPAIPPDSVLQTQAPLMLPGEGGVTDRGDSTYRIPLWVADGPAGVHPVLSLVYRGALPSRLGVGWSIAGLSAITPCRKTIAAEGMASGVAFDRGDTYSIDGQRMVTDGIFRPPLEKNPKHPDAFDLMWHTQVESFKRILAHYERNDDRQPRRFTVAQRDGRVLTYEPRPASRVQGVDEDTGPELASGHQEADVVPVYALVREDDRCGNRIQYEYESDEKPAGASPFEFSYRIAKISYSFVGGTPRRWLRFVYNELRPDPAFSNLSGVQAVMRSLLKSIEMNAPNPTDTQTVWAYYLDYELSPETRRHLLTSVKLCPQSGMCSWERRFEYTTAAKDVVVVTGSDAPEFDAKALSQDPYSALDAVTLGFLPRTDVRLMLFDANGDGSDDCLYRVAPSRPYPRFSYGSSIWLNDKGQEQSYNSWNYYAYAYQLGDIRLRLADGASFFGAPKSMTQLFEPWDQAQWAQDLINNVKSGQAMWQVHLGKSRVGDFNHDGVPDLMLARTRVTPTSGFWTEPGQGRPSYDKWAFGYTRVHGFPWPQIGDLEDISLTGPVWHHTGHFIPGETKYNFHLFTPPFQRALADLDGDSRIDILDAFDEYSLFQDIGQDWSDVSGYKFRREWMTQLGGGSSFGGATKGWIPLVHPWTEGNGKLIVSDLDGNGRDDVLANQDDKSDVVVQGGLSAGLYTWLSLSPTAGWSPVVREPSKLWTGDENAYPPDLLIGDFNGDGLDDALYPPGSRNGNTEALVRWNVGNGFGKLTQMPVVAGAQQQLSQQILRDLLNQPLPKDMHQGEPIQWWDRGTRVVDLNGDGRSDILAFRLWIAGCAAPQSFLFCQELPTLVLAYLSRGDALEARILKLWPNGGASLAEGFTTAQVGDVDGDGAVDVVHVVGGKLHVMRLPWREQPDLLSEVTDTGCHDALETFAYSRAWWGDGLRPPPAPRAWPGPVGVHRGFPVVRHHAVFTGMRADAVAPLYRTTRHRYESPVSDPIGRGFLGFQTHRIWDTQLGQETITTFDTATMVDPRPSDPAALVPSDGGRFYPFASLPKSIRTITPLAPLPTELEVEGDSVMPGLDGTTLVDVRMVMTENNYEARNYQPDSDHSLGGRVITVLRKGFVTSEYETRAAADVTSETPTYIIWEPTAPLRKRTGAYDHDEWGNLSYESVETEGGVRRVSTYEYDYRPKDWLLGLCSTATLSVYTPGPADVVDPAVPVRVVRSTYDERGLLQTCESRARGPGFQACTALNKPAEACEDKALLVEVLARDMHGNIAVVSSMAWDEALPRPTALTYDDEGIYVTDVVNAKGHVGTSLRHPALGVPVLSVDPNGVATTLQYDGFGRLRGWSRPGAVSVQRTYAEYANVNQRGLTVEDTAADGSYASHSYDERGRLVETRLRGFSGETIVANQKFDAFGHLVFASRSAVNAPSPDGDSFAYDRIGRRLRQVAADTATTTWTHSMFETTTSDPVGDEAYEVRDVDDRVIERGHRRKEGGQVEEYGEVHFEYGPFDQLQFVRDALGNETGITYDVFGRRLQVADPSLGTTHLVHNGFGELRHVTKADAVVLDYSYDEVGRLLKATGPDGELVCTWDQGTGATGRLSATKAPTGILTEYVYDQWGRLRSKTLAIGHGAYPVDYGYDDDGRLRYVWYPPSSSKGERFTIAYLYNQAGYLRAIVDVTGCRIDPAAPVWNRRCVGTTLWRIDARNSDLALTQAQFGTGQSLFRGYEPLSGRLKGWSLSGTAHGETYHYFADGNLRERINTESGHLEIFGYDNLDRLTLWSILKQAKLESPLVEKVGERDYSYDEIGNLYKVRSGVKDKQTVFAGVFDADGRSYTLDSSNVAGSFVYDDCGRQISGAGRALAWTQFDQLAHVGASVFEYDGLGARVLKRDRSGASTVYVDDIYEHHVEQGTERHTHLVYADIGAIAEVTRVDDAPLLTRRYLVPDHLGSSVVELDDGGSVLESRSYDPFGGLVDATGAPTPQAQEPVTVGFTGHEHDGGGLINMKGRIYDREQYRFLSPDPWITRPLFGQSYNRYSYVLNNPLRYIDPAGYDGEGEGAAPAGGEMPDGQTSDPSADDYVGYSPINTDVCDKGWTLVHEGGSFILCREDDARKVGSRVLTDGDRGTGASDNAESRSAAGVQAPHGTVRGAGGGGEPESPGPSWSVAYQGMPPSAMPQDQGDSGGSHSVEASAGAVRGLKVALRLTEKAATYVLAEAVQVGSDIPASGTVANYAFGAGAAAVGGIAALTPVLPVATMVGAMEKSPEGRWGKFFHSLGAVTAGTGATVLGAGAIVAAFGAPSGVGAIPGLGIMAIGGKVSLFGTGLMGFGGGISALEVGPQPGGPQGSVPRFAGGVAAGVVGSELAASIVGLF